MHRIPSFTLEPPASTLFGNGTVRRLPELIASLSQRRAFVVTDRGVVAAGVAGSVEDILARADIEVGTFADVRPNPGTETLDAGAGAIRSFGEGVVIALGGGAVIDVAKGVALMAVNTGSARDFSFGRTLERAGLPLLAVPTTAGTGSETNAWGVIDDHERGSKYYVGHRSVAPRFVVLDPELTVGVPPGPTAAAGMDALTHALESLSSIHRNPYADALNLGVVRMVRQNLPRAVADGSDLDARAQMLLAAHMAGLAFAGTGLGMAHALGHALSARAGAPHGTVLAVLLPHVLTFNLPVCEAFYAGLAGALEVPRSGLNQWEQAEAVIQTVRELATAVGIPRSLGKLGCSADQIDVVAADALRDEVMSNTPRQPTHEDLVGLLRAAL